MANEDDEVPRQCVPLWRSVGMDSALATYRHSPPPLSRQLLGLTGRPMPLPRHPVVAERLLIPGQRLRAKLQHRGIVAARAQPKIAVHLRTRHPMVSQRRFGLRLHRSSPHPRHPAPMFSAVTTRLPRPQSDVHDIPAAVPAAPAKQGLLVHLPQQLLRHVQLMSLTKENQNLLLPGHVQQRSPQQPHRTYSLNGKSEREIPAVHHRAVQAAEKLLPHARQRSREVLPKGNLRGQESAAGAMVAGMGEGTSYLWRPRISMGSVGSLTICLKGGNRNERRGKESRTRLGRQKEGGAVAERRARRMLRDVMIFMIAVAMSGRIARSHRDVMTARNQGSQGSETSAEFQESMMSARSVTNEKIAIIAKR